MAEDWKKWSAKRVQRIIEAYVQTHPELLDAPLDKLIYAALEDAGYDPVEVLAAVETSREVNWLGNLVKKAAEVANMITPDTLPGLDPPAIVQTGTDERGVPIITDGRKATPEQIAQHYESLALEDARKAALSEKQAKTARATVRKLESLGVDVSTTVYDDIPAAVFTRLRDGLA